MGYSPRGASGQGAATGAGGPAGELAPGRRHPSEGSSTARPPEEVPQPSAIRPGEVGHGCAGSPDLTWLPEGGRGDTRPYPA